MPPTYLILGAGLAGVSAAATLRKEGLQGDVVLVGDEPHLPYDRPPLSKQYLRGDRTSDGILLRPSSFYEENGIQTRLGVRATRVDSTSRLLETSDGPIHYDKLLIASGSRNRRLDVPGSDLEGVHDLRILLGETLAAFEGRGWVERAVTSSGRSIECDFAAVGVGVEPTSEPAMDGGTRKNTTSNTLDSMPRGTTWFCGAASKTASSWPSTWQPGE
jgi:3-phenylpropionate/trans-cinnamate dioxygenase ferredoxin reductase subunit